MNSNQRQQQIVHQRKEDYLHLIVKQKTAALDRCQKRLAEKFIDQKTEEELLRLTDRPMCKPKILTSTDAIPMNDDDYLLAELNGHFQ